MPDNGKRTRKASSKVTNPNNDGDLQLTSHKRAHKNAVQGVSTENPLSPNTTSETLQPSTSLNTGTKRPTPINLDSDPDVQDSADGEGPSKRARRQTPESSDDDNEDASKVSTAIPYKERSRNVDQFFDKPMLLSGKKRRRCKKCSHKKGSDVTFVNEVTTLRRHIQADHAGGYQTWAAKNKFESMLPADVKQRKAATSANKAQTQLDPHLQDIPTKERIIPYSDKIFCEAAIEWLISTDQPIQALEHPAFKNMIAIAARSTNGVIIPNQKATRREIIDMFKKNLTDLRTRLNSNAVQGEISLTGDAWQASNQDAYLVGTGHWIEETSPGAWTLQSALFGFTQMNNAHNGVCLGRALFKIVKRLKIEHKIGWITCDNASNNNTMLEQFAERLNQSPKRENMAQWNHSTRRIRCLAHVINLATQAVITTYSKAKHYDPANPEAHEPDFTSFTRDEVGLVRTITVKVRSSAKRKQMFLDNQQSDGLKNPKILLLDMPVCWSSTYVMLERAKSLKKFVDDIVFDMGREEKDLEKHKKLTDLQLDTEEWDHVKNFLDLLAHADRAQQAFSSENEPALSLVIPILEKLYKAWNTRTEKVKYSRFSPALRAGLAKIEEYYEKTSSSHAYTFAMLLDPNEKMGQFKRLGWSTDLQREILKSAEDIFKERHVKMYGPDAAGPSRLLRQARKKTEILLRRPVSSDDESDIEENVSINAHTSTPWLSEFNRYLDSHDKVPKGMGLPKWWGINAQRLPVWASLARDHLAIMASSVSSERAFSAAGITISKQRNRLHHDIVEALQFLKTMIWKDLLFREKGPSSEVELDNDVEVVDDDGDEMWVDEDEHPVGWDSLLLEGEEDGEF